MRSVFIFKERSSEISNFKSLRMFRFLLRQVGNRIGDIGFVVQSHAEAWLWSVKDLVGMD